MQAIDSDLFRENRQSLHDSNASPGMGLFCPAVPQGMRDDAMTEEAGT
jgi:hypothetical protein